MMKPFFLSASALTCAVGILPATAETPLTYGVRPFYLIDQMRDSDLRDQLQACMMQSPSVSQFSIGHRGAPMQFPEHTVESNVAAAQMGAGILECDVTFTADLELVCRHAQNDLHTTTNILATDLADTCVTPFTAASGDDPATAECRTSELTLDQFMSLSPKMDAADSSATTVDAYLGGTANWRTDLYSAEPATMMTHAESIALFDSLGADFTPELKTPSVDMPFNGYTQEDYAQALIDEYVEAGIPPERVWPQSFNLEDVLYWINNTEYGDQAVYLMDEYDIEGYSPMDPATWPNTMNELSEMGVNWIAPPTWMLVTLDASGTIVPSTLATEAQAAGLGIITWTVERSGPLGGGGGWYYQSVADAAVERGDGVMFELIHALAQDVGVAGIFSDWPATTTYYANCMGLD